MIKETILAVMISCSYVSNYDGDTVKITCPNIPFQHGMSYTGNVRIRGVDTPELRGKCFNEKSLAKTAKLSTYGFLVEKPLRVNYYGHGKYGRPIVDIIVGDVSLADYLISTDVGKIYNGGKRKKWCNN